MIELPPIARVRSREQHSRVSDPAEAVRKAILESRLRDRVKPGGRVALGVGSRGINHIATMARAAVDAIRTLGFDPFVVAAMGSHGGATPDGQRAILSEYGITSDSMRAPVHTEMDTVVVGTSHIGLPIFFDQNAFAADGVVLLNRIKPHTDFRGRHESGILKMLTIGLGKQVGAEQVHKLGLRGMIEVLPAVGRILIEKTPFALGVAILENAADEPAEIVGIEPENLLEIEPRLLERARGLMAQLPFDQIDVLIVGELGKDYSGAGMDPNVLGRLYIETQPDFQRPVVTRLAVLDASPSSAGNIVGVGFADLTTHRLVQQLDQAKFNLNILTSCFLERARIPIALPTDLDVLNTAIQTCWRVNASDARLVLIPNTLELTTLWVSPALESELRELPNWERDSDYQPIPFSADGELQQAKLFPESKRAKRSLATA
jgi:hypothetical protein